MGLLKKGIPFSGPFKITLVAQSKAIPLVDEQGLEAKASRSGIPGFRNLLGYPGVPGVPQSEAIKRGLLKGAMRIKIIRAPGAPWGPIWDENLSRA